MKNFFKLLQILILSLIINACSQSEENGLVSNEKINLTFQKTEANTVSRITNWTLNNNIISSFDSNNYRTENTQFDFNNAISYFDESGKETIIINEINFDIENEINYALTFINDESLSQFMIIKTISESENVKKVESYNFENELIYTTIFDANSENISIVLPTHENRNNQNRDFVYSCNATWGENTQACLVDVYTNHGWASVWATVQTAFIPQTAAALAAACAFDALTDGSCGDYSPIE